MQVAEPHRRIKLSREKKREVLTKLAGKKRYIVTTDLKAITFSYTEIKHAIEEKARRFVEEGLLFPGNFKPQRYYLTAEEATQAIAEKPPEKKIDYSKIKCVVTQAPPATGGSASQSQQIKHEKEQKEHGSYCPNYTNLAVVTAAEMAAGKSPIRHKNYGELGARIFTKYCDGLLLKDALDALDALPTTEQKGHNIRVTFRTPHLPDLSLFKDIKDHNKGLRSKGKANGIPYTVERFDTGAVNILYQLTKSPISHDELVPLLEATRSSLALETPSVNHWQVFFVESNCDIPIPPKALRGFKLDAFHYGDTKIKIYPRKLADGKRYLRIESHEKPLIPVSEYRSYMETIAFPKLLEVCGK